MPSPAPLNLVPLLPVLALLPEPDLDHLSEAAEARFLHDPCGEYQLDVRETNDLGAISSTTLTVSAKARLEGERWTLHSADITDPGNGSSMVWTSVGDQQIPFVLPMLGRTAGEDEGLGSEGRALLDQAVAIARSDVGADSAGIELYEGREHYRLDMLLGGGWSLFRGREDNTAAIVIDPVSGRAREWRLDIRDPTKLQVGRLVFLNAQLAVDPAGLPLRETLHTKARLGPFGLTVERTITYTRLGDCTAPVNDSVPINDSAPAAE